MKRLSIQLFFRKYNLLRDVNIHEIQFLDRQRSLLPWKRAWWDDLGFTRGSIFFLLTGSSH